MNPMDLLKNMGQLQEKMQEAQARIRRTTVTGSAGGDMVRITMNGEFQMLTVEISSEAIDPADPSMLQDLIRAAHNDASARIKETLRQDISAMTGDMPLPPELFGAG